MLQLARRKRVAKQVSGRDSTPDINIITVTGTRNGKLLASGKFEIDTDPTELCRINLWARFDVEGAKACRYTVQGM